jgi:hypothetical protein
MSTPLRPDQSPSLPHPSRRHTPGGHGKQDPRKLLVIAMITSGLAALVTGIAIGNAARKRIDRWSHPISS